ncbi:MAG: FkbM family methyltransferase [Candidatus Paceibacterales bacterium]
MGRIIMAKPISKYLKKIKFQFYHRLAYIYVAIFAKNKTSYSMLKEDLILDILTGFKPKGYKGCYVDIGANDPNAISSTKKFYERGWRGVNIEPSKRMYDLLLQYRPEDINLNCAVGKGNEVTYYEGIDNTTGSTCSEETIKEKAGVYEADKMLVKKITTVPLGKIFADNHLQTVDFISLDVEGFEWDVIKSNDWNKYKARVLCIEGQGYDKFFSNYGYKKVLFDGLNTFYKLHAN